MRLLRTGWDAFSLFVDESLNKYMKSEAVGSTYSVYILCQSGRLSNESPQLEAIWNGWGSDSIMRIPLTGVNIY